MIWIKVTHIRYDKTRETRWLNANRIEHFMKAFQQPGTFIQFSGEEGDWMFVDETPEEILEQLNDQSSIPHRTST